MNKYNLSTFHITQQGFKNIISQSVCQDYSLSYSAPDDSLHIAIVADGHGASKYFRSDKGAQFAVEVTMEALKNMPDITDKIKGKAGSVPERDTKEFYEIYQDIKEIHPIFERLFQHIYFEWTRRIEQDIEENPLNEEEKKNVGRNPIIAYGTTLLACIRTSNYWFGFQIGDGICLALNDKGKWFEPIPECKECISPKTTSLCEPEAYKKFRYAFSGKGDFPIAFFLTTDGIEDSWGKKLPMYFTSILDDIMNHGIDKAKDLLIRSLPELSQKGSQDDVSLAWIIDLSKLKESLSKTHSYIENMEIKELQAILKKKNEEILALSTLNNALKQAQKEIEEKYNYLKKDFNDYKSKIEGENKKKLHDLEIEKRKNKELSEQLKLLEKKRVENEENLEKLIKEKEELQIKITQLENELALLKTEKQEIKQNDELPKMEFQNKIKEMSDEGSQENVDKIENQEKKNEKQTHNLKQFIFIMAGFLIGSLITFFGLKHYSNNEKDMNDKISIDTITTTQEKSIKKDTTSANKINTDTVIQRKSDTFKNIVDSIMHDSLSINATQKE